MKRSVVLFSFALVFSLACERETNTLGPNLSDLYGEFQLLEAFDVSNSKLDFSSGDEAVFTARFSKTVDWQVRVVGRTSGAIKIFEGKSKVIDELNGTWKGTTTILPMFKAETCDAYLSIPEEGYNDTLLVIVIDSTKNYDGLLLSDFEDGLNSGWTIFSQTGADMKFNVVQDDSSAQGFNYYKMGGAVGWDWLIGYIDMPGSAYGSTHYPLSSIASDVYFNFFLDKKAAVNNEVILFQFTEDDNEDGSYQASSEDMFSIEIKGVENFWQTYNLLYEDLQTLVNGAPVPDIGNGLREPHKLINIRMLFLADPNSGYSETDIDYLIFTEGNALEP